MKTVREFKNSEAAALTLKPPPGLKLCRKCAGSGKVDSGNGTTRPCDCKAGRHEAERRKGLRAKARAKR